MSDLLLDLSSNPQAASLIKRLGLPVPMPTPLKRARAPRRERFLVGESVAAHFVADGPVSSAAAAVIVKAGGGLHLSAHTPASLPELSEAWGAPLAELDLEAEPGRERFAGLVFDGTDIGDVGELLPLYAFFHALVRRVKKGSGRVVVLGRPPSSAPDARGAAAQAALEGFVRSLAKELGKRGATAQLLTVAPGAEDRLEGPLRFLLSERSAYVSGQPLHIDARAAALASPAPLERPLEGKRALVTGCARGIGRATAIILAAEGARVTCLDRPDDQGKAAEVARHIGGDVLGIDVTAEDAGARIAEAFEGGLDIVVHNAGVTRDRTIAKMRESSWSLTLDVNLGAVDRITHHLIDTGTLREGGRVVCLSSVAGIAGNMGQTNYAAAKSGIIGYVRAMAEPLSGRGITINAIAPGFIETRMTAAIPAAIREVARRMNNLGQAGDPRDVGEAIAFLATPGSQGITGQVLRVCGGALIGA